MTDLCQVLVHMRAGRWIEAHNVVQSNVTSHIDGFLSSFARP